MKIKYTKVRLMCPICYHLSKPFKEIKCIKTKGKKIIAINDYFYNTECPNCKEDYEQIVVDSKIAKTIQIFNKKGYKTLFCCKGHKHYSTEPYIYFNENYGLTNLPNTWFFDNCKEYGDKYIIRSTSNTKYRLKHIYKYAKSLPYLDDNEN